VNKNTLILLGVLIAVIAFLSGVAFMEMRVGSQLTNAINNQQQDIAGISQQISQLKAMLEKFPLNEINDQQAKINGISQQLSQMKDLIAKGQKPSGGIPEDFTKVYTIPVGESPLRGAAAAKVTITGFLDVECPFSSRFHPVIAQVLEAYPGNVNYMVKHFPLSFHANAKLAAKFILAAGKQGKYWEMLDIILKDNKDLSEKRLEGMASSIKLDLTRLKADIKANDAQWEKLIQEDFDLGASVQVSGTPTYYINGRKTKARNLEAFKAEIDAILKK